MVTFESLSQKKDKLAVVGLGYVGLPLAVHLARHFDVVGYRRSRDRIEELKNGMDRTREVSEKDLLESSIRFTSEAGELRSCRMIIVAVPTPIDSHRNPDLGPLKSATAIVGEHIQKGSCVVFESTVFPGATEEVCVPILEEKSGLTFESDFSVGYSPERNNPGDRKHTLPSVIKVISGSDDTALDLIEKVYGTVVKSGLHRAPKIRVAEAAKVIENTQRDINIALMNELAMIFEKMNIDTSDVLAAAGTKWNFLKEFKPGLVGGHCIGVDPYYLTFKAQSLGYHPDMILAGRRVNDNMGKYIAERTVKLLAKVGKAARSSRVAILGLTFKENVPDLRNTRVVDIIEELREYGARVEIHDPLADPEEAVTEYGIDLVRLKDMKEMDAVILAVMHDEYRELGLSGVIGLCRKENRPLIMDVKGMFDTRDIPGEIEYWRL